MHQTKLRHIKTLILIFNSFFVQIRTELVVNDVIKASVHLSILVTFPECSYNQSNIFLKYKNYYFLSVCILKT